MHYKNGKRQLEAKTSKLHCAQLCTMFAVLFAILSNPAWGATLPAIRAAITSDALYSVSSANLAAAFGTTESQIIGWLQNRQISVDSIGRPISAIYASNSISFFAQGFSSKYTGQNVYWIRQAPGTVVKTIVTAAASITNGQSFRVTKAVEQNLVLRSDMVTDVNADPWFWQLLQPNSTLQKTLKVTVDLPGVTVGDTLTYNLMGSVSSGSDVLSVSLSNKLNYVTLGSATVSGYSYVVSTASVSSAVFSPTNNTILITATTLNGESVYVDKFSIAYRRSYTAISNELVFAADTNDPVTVTGFTSSNIEIYDVTTPQNPLLVTGWTLSGSNGNYGASFHPASCAGQFVAVSGGFRHAPVSLVASTPSNLRNQAKGADYIAITVSSFTNVVRQLVTYRSSHHLNSMLVDVQNIYDEFNYGLPDPRAIGAFLGYAFRMWNTSPRYAVLVGSGSLDFRNNKGYGDCIIPPLVMVDSSGLQATDDPLGDFDGDGAAEGPSAVSPS